MLKSLTPFVLAFLMMGLIYAPSINGYPLPQILKLPRIIDACRALQWRSRRWRSWR